MNRTTATVAVIDDDAAYIRFMERALGSLGYGCTPITTFHVGDVAALVEQGGYEAAVLDIYMYDRVLGFACVDAIRQGERGKHLPLVVASGAHSKLASQSDFLREVGCVPLLKPFGLEDLTHALHMAKSLTEARMPRVPVQLPELAPQTLPHAQPGFMA